MQTTTDGLAGATTAIDATDDALGKLAVKVQTTTDGLAGATTKIDATDEALDDTKSELKDVGDAVVKQNGVIDVVSKAVEDVQCGWTGYKCTCGQVSSDYHKDWKSGFSLFRMVVCEQCADGIRGQKSYLPTQATVFCPTDTLQCPTLRELKRRLCGQDVWHKDENPYYPKSPLPEIITADDWKRVKSKLAAGAEADWCPSHHIVTTANIGGPRNWDAGYNREFNGACRHCRLGEPRDAPHNVIKVHVDTRAHLDMNACPT